MPLNIVSSNKNLILDNILSISHICFVPPNWIPIVCTITHWQNKLHDVLPSDTWENVHLGGIMHYAEEYCLTQSQIWIQLTDLSCKHPSVIAVPPIPWTSLFIAIRNISEVWQAPGEQEPISSFIYSGGRLSSNGCDAVVLAPIAYMYTTDQLCQIAF